MRPQERPPDRQLARRQASGRGRARRTIGQLWLATVDGAARSAGTVVHDQQQVTAALATRQRPRDPPADHRARHGQVRRRSPPTATVTVGVYADRRRLPDAGQAHPATSPPRSAPVAGVTGVRVELGRDERRAAHGAADQPARAAPAEPVIPFAQPGSLHPGVRGRLRQGRRRQVVGHGEPGRRAGRARACRSASSTPTSTATRVPRMLGVDGPAHPGRGHDHAAAGARREGHLDRHVHRRATPPVVWRGPMLHRALQQFLADVYWGDLDVLLLDLPPGHRRHRDLGGPAACRTPRSSS